MTMLRGHLKKPENREEIKKFAIEEYNKNLIEIDNFIDTKIKNSKTFRYIFAENKMLKEILKKEFKGKYDDLFLKLESGKIKPFEIKNLVENVGGAGNGNHEELRKN